MPTIVPAANPPSTPAAIAPPSPAFAGDETAANGIAVATKRTLTVFRTAVSPENALLNANNYRQRVNKVLWWEGFEHLGKCARVLEGPRPHTEACALGHYHCETNILRVRILLRAPWVSP